MAAAETLAEMRALFRDITGMQATTQITDTVIDEQINDFYVHKMTKEVEVGEAKGDQSVVVGPHLSNVFDIPTIDSDIIEVRKPFFIDGEEIPVFTDKSTFFGQFPEDSDVVQVVTAADTTTGANLSVGSSDAKDVRHGGFYYEIGGFTYFINFAEATMTGDTLPANKFGSWLFEATDERTFVVSASSLNITGHNSFKAAFDALPTPDSSRAIVGYLLIANSPGITYEPGVDDLSKVGVDTYFVEAKPGSVKIPDAVLIHDNKITVRPRSDNVRRLEFSILTKRTALSGDSDEPDNKEWGKLIAYGAAISYLTQKKKLVTQGMVAVFTKEKQWVNHVLLQKHAKNTTTQRALI